MINLSIGFKFKPAKVEKTNKHKSNKISKKTYCVCVEEEVGIFKAYINIPSSLEFPDTLSIPFTKNSYSLKNKTVVFSKNPDKNGRHCVYIRSKTQAYSFPGLEELYTPFRDRYVYSGYIVKNENKQHEFEIIDIIDTYANASNLVPNIRLNNSKK